jgi:ParB-like chromosome segregation protein Spo0J
VQDASDDAPEPPVILLNVTYPEAYPDVGPYLDVTSPPNASKYPLLDPAEDKAQLLEKLEPTIEESLGMAMVFTLVSTLKEAAEALIEERQKAEEQAREVAARKAEEEENRKFHGTVVTPESFLEWRSKFRKEMEEKEKLRKEEEESDAKGKKGKVEEKKLTGRQLWERGLVGKGDEEELEGEDAVEAVSKLKVTD